MSKTERIAYKKGNQLRKKAMMALKMKNGKSHHAYLRTGYIQNGKYS